MKLYGIQVDPQFQGKIEFDWLQEDITSQLECIGVLNGGSYRDFAEIMPKNIEEARDILTGGCGYWDDFGDIIEALRDGNGRDNYNCYVYGIKKLREAFDYFMRDYNLTRSQRVKVADVIYRYRQEYKDLTDYLAELMEALTGKKWFSGSIRGCSQGDYMRVVYSEEVTDDYMEYVENVYWNTGTEWMLVELDEKIEAEDEEELLAEIERLYQDGDGYCEYVVDWDAKRGLAKSHGIKEEDVTLFECSGGYTYTTSYRLVS